MGGKATKRRKGKSISEGQAVSVEKWKQGFILDGVGGRQLPEPSNELGHCFSSCKILSVIVKSCAYMGDKNICIADSAAATLC